MTQSPPNPEPTTFINQKRPKRTGKTQTPDHRPHPGPGWDRFPVSRHGTHAGVAAGNIDRRPLVCRLPSQPSARINCLSSTNRPRGMETALSLSVSVWCLRLLHASPAINRSWLEDALLLWLSDARHPLLLCRAGLAGSPVMSYYAKLNTTGGFCCSTPQVLRGAYHNSAGVNRRPPSRTRSDGERIDAAVLASVWPGLAAR